MTDINSPQSDLGGSERSGSVGVTDNANAETDVGAHAVTPQRTAGGSLGEDDGINTEGTQIVTTAYVVEHAIEDAEKIQVLERRIQDYQERENALAYADVISRDTRLHAIRFPQVICVVVTASLIIVAVVYAITNENNIPATSNTTDLATGNTSDPSERSTTASNQVDPISDVADPNETTDIPAPGGMTELPIATDSSQENTASNQSLSPLEQVGSDLRGENLWDLFGASTAISANGARVMAGPCPRLQLVDRIG